jgi:hypothetical protein
VNGCSCYFILFYDGKLQSLIFQFLRGSRFGFGASLAGGAGGFGGGDDGSSLI